MKNVKIILLLSVILCFFYFIKINEGFGLGDILGFLTTGTTDSSDTTADTTTDTTADTTTDTTADTTADTKTTQKVCPTSTATTTEARRSNTSLMNICSTDDAVRNLNDNISHLPPATLVYPKDPVSIKYLKLLPEDLTRGNTTITDGHNQNEVSFTDILKDSQNSLQTWWEYDFKDSTKTPEINIKDSNNEEINTNVDLVYLSGCSQIITSDESSESGANNGNTALQCHNYKTLNDCNLQNNCVWDALCEQPHRNEEHSNKIFTPKECILNGGIFRSDLLHYAKNSIVNGNIATSFNVKDIPDFWSGITNSLDATGMDAGQNDSDSCSFNPTNLQDSYLSKLTQSSEITGSYLDSSCYPPLMKRMFGDTPDIDNILGVDADDENITITNSGAIFKSDNSYNKPKNFFNFKINNRDCKWSKRMNTPEQFAHCFNEDIDLKTLPSISEWSDYMCDRWSTDNHDDNCSTNTGNTRLNSEKIIENSNLSNDTLKEYCCLPDYTCTNIQGVEQDVTQFSCPQDSRFSSNRDTCSEEGCSHDECCSPAFTCNNIHGVGSDNVPQSFVCPENTLLKVNPDNCSNDGCTQSECCEEHPMCTSHYPSDEECPEGYYPDTNARCTTPDCSNDDYHCCIQKANCSSFHCNTGYKLKNNGRTNCPTDAGSCINGICCEPEPTCSDMSGSIECTTGKKLDGNKIWHNYDTGLCCIDEALPLTSPRSTCGAEAEAETFQCPDDKPILDTYNLCSGDNCDIDNCCKPETYFCKSRDSDVIYQNVGDPPDSISDNEPCSSGGLTNFIWESCSDALSSIDLSSYPYIGNIYQACRVESPSEQSVHSDFHVPHEVNNPSQPSCSADICTTGKVLKSHTPPICGSETCTIDECCVDDNTLCSNYYPSNPCPGENKPDGVCNGPCKESDCCLPSINLSLQISDDPSTGTVPGSGQSSSLNTILQTYLNKMIKTPELDETGNNINYFTSDDSWNKYKVSSFFTMKYTPTDNILPEDYNTDPNTDPDFNSIKFYVKGSYDAQDISNLVRLNDITETGNRDILTFIVELNNLHFKSSAQINIPIVGDITFNCGDSNFQSSDIYLYKFLLYKEDNHLKLYTSSVQGQDIDSFIASSTSPTSPPDVHYDIGSINGDKITFDINSILTQISSNLSSPTPKSFEQILLKLLALRTDDIHDMFFGDTGATINVDIETLLGTTTISTTITNENSPNGNSLENKICNLDLDIDKTDSWSFNYGLINSYLSTYDFADLTESDSPPHPPTPGIDNFVKYDNGLSFNTHFSVCPEDFTISDIPSLIIRLKELILTGIDIYTLYTSETGNQFNKDTIGCNGSSTLVDGSVFTPEEIRTINSFLTNDSIFTNDSIITTDEITTINSFISNYGIDISNLQYTSSADTSSADTSSPGNIHYTSGGKNIDTIVLTIS